MGMAHDDDAGDDAGTIDEQTDAPGVADQRSFAAFGAGGQSTIADHSEDDE